MRVVLQLTKGRIALAERVQTPSGAVCIFRTFLGLVSLV